MATSWTFSILIAVLILVAAASVLAPIIFWRRRYAYGATLCVVLMGILLFFWVRDRDGYDYLEIYRPFLTDHDVGDRRLTMQSDAGRIELQLQVYRDTAPATSKSAMAQVAREGPLFKGFGVTWGRQFGSIRWLWTNRLSPKDPFLKRLGFGGLRSLVRTQNPTYTVTTTAVYFPIWLPITILSLLPLSWVAAIPHRRRKRWAAEGKCRACGYNLMGTPPKEDATRVCSECGANNPAAPLAQLKPDSSEIPADKHKKLN